MRRRSERAFGAADTGRPGRRGRRSGRRRLGGRHRPRPRRLSTPRPGSLLTTFGNDLDSPAGIATDATGHVWVADTGHDRVVEFSPVGRVLAVFGSPGRGRGQLDQPVALAVTPFGDVWVADQGNSRVEEFSAIGRYRTSFAVPTPAGIGLDVHGDVWVPARPTRLATRSRSSPRPGISSGRSAPPRRVTATSAIPAASPSARPGGSTSPSPTTAWCRCSVRPGASTPNSACSQAPARRTRTWSSRRAWRSPPAGRSGWPTAATTGSSSSAGSRASR